MFPTFTSHRKLQAHSEGPTLSRAEGVCISQPLNTKHLQQQLNPTHCDMGDRHAPLHCLPRSSESCTLPT